MEAYIVFSSELSEKYKEKLELCLTSKDNEFQWDEGEASTSSAASRSFVRDYNHILLGLSNVLNSEEELYTRTPRIFQINPLENEDDDSHIISVFTPVKRFSIKREIPIMEFKRYLDMKEEPGDIYEELVTNPLTRMVSDNIEDIYIYLFNYPNPSLVPNYKYREI